MNFNKTIVVGRVVRDIEVRYVGEGQMAVTNNAVAINDRRKVRGEYEEETTFVDFVVFGKTAEVFAEYSGKGKEVLLEGKLRNDRWEDSDGNKRSKLELVVDKLVLGNKSDSASTSSDEDDDSGSEPGDDDVPF